LTRIVEKNYREPATESQGGVGTRQVAAETRRGQFARQPFHAGGSHEKSPWHVQRGEQTGEHRETAWQPMAMQTAPQVHSLVSWQVGGGSPQKILAKQCAPPSAANAQKHCSNWSSVGSVAASQAASGHPQAPSTHA
jgi:hypothetical protein